MRHLSRIFLLVAVLFSSTCVHAQTPPFDVGAYKQFLASHGAITAAQVMAENPAPLFLRKAPTAAPPAWLDSVRIKYALTGDELALLNANGFLVTERLNRNSFGEALIDVWTNDLPVFIGSDAILHAVHMSYDKILMAIEGSALQPGMLALLNDMRTISLPALEAAYGSNPAMLPMLRDIDVYLTVALSLMRAQPVAPRYAESQATVDELLVYIRNGQPVRYPLFSSTDRIMDFSQFTVRGHYTLQPWLGAYFQSMIWLGRTEFMLSSPKQPGVPDQSPADIRRQTVGAYLLKEAVALAPARVQLDSIDQVLTALVGESDNIRLAHLQSLADETGFTRADQLLDAGTLAAFQTLLATKPFAGQRINSQILMSDAMLPDQLTPPSAFILLGQRFIIDSYVFGSVVYDKILHNGEKVLRMLPKAQDALFALGNNASAQLLQDELGRYHYAPNLAALRYLIDSYGDDFWNASLYNSWLNAIRALNPPAAIEGLPAFMQTAGWWQQKMNTQLASWAQLRHDNLLYAKQSYTGGNTCSYPEGYVEPVPAFYERLARFARSAAPLFGNNPANASIARFFLTMAPILDTLQTIAGKELAGAALTDAETVFIQSAVYYKSYGCFIDINGWYPKLFFDCQFTDPNYVIADVHTAPTDEFGNAVGWVMHAAAGRPNIGFVTAPSRNGGTTVYTGPFFTYYETVTTNFTRLTDEEWEKTVLGNPVPRPSWSNNYLADAQGGRKAEGPSLLTILSDVTDPAASVPGAPVLHAAYPNPFGSSGGTVISFTLPHGTPAATTVDVFDVNGRLVRRLLSRAMDEGTYLLRWNDPVPPGVYMCRLTSGPVIRGTTLVVTR